MRTEKEFEMTHFNVWYRKDLHGKSFGCIHVVANSIEKAIEKAIATVEGEMEVYRVCDNCNVTLWESK